MMKIQIPKCDFDVTDVLRVQVDLSAALNHASDRASRSVARALDRGLA